MRMLTLTFISLGFLGCTNSNPEVGYLQDPNFGKTLPAAAGSFVTGDISGSGSHLATSGYKATILVHSGSQAQTAVTTDNSYHLFLKDTDQ